jgi:hypothetical protein
MKNEKPTKYWDKIAVHKEFKIFFLFIACFSFVLCSNIAQAAPLGVGFNSPSSNTFYNGSSLSLINVSVNETNINTTTVSIINNATGSTVWSGSNSSTGNVLFYPAFSTEGNYNITAVTTDLSGNSNSSTITNLTFNQIPGVTINDPIANQRINLIYMINASISDLYFSSAWYNLSNSSGNQWNGTLASNGSYYTVYLNTSKVSDGNYNLTIHALDSYGLEGNQTINISIDNTAPVWYFNLYPRIANTTWCNNSCPLDAYVMDSNLKQVNINVTNSSGSVCYSYINGTTNITTWYGAGISPMNLTNCTEGALTIRLWSADKGSSPPMTKMVLYAGLQTIASNSAIKDRTVQMDDKTPMSFKENDKLVDSFKIGTSFIPKIQAQLIDNDKHFKIGWTVPAGSKSVYINFTCNEFYRGYESDRIFCGNYYFSLSDFTANKIEFKITDKGKGEFRIDLPNLDTTKEVILDPIVGMLNQMDYNYTIYEDRTTPILAFTSPTQPNNTQVNTNWTEANISINETNLNTFYYDVDYTGMDRYLVGYWRLDNNSAYGENSSLAYDYSGNGNNGTCSGSACPNFTANGKKGGAYQFDGGVHYINTSTSSTLKPAQNLTIEVWVNPSSNQSQYSDIAGEHCATSGWVIQQNVSQTNAYYFYYTGTIGAFSSNLIYLTANVWNHITIVKNSTHVTFYNNGNYAGGYASSTNITYSGGWNPLIGNGCYSTARYFNGTIDEFRIYNTSLTAAQVNQRYLSTRSKFYDDSLVLAMNFNNNSAIGENSTYFVDVSKYGNNGTCSGTTCPTYNSSGKFGGGMQFDGDDVVNISHSSSLNLSNITTVGVWFNSNYFGPSTPNTILGKKGVVYDEFWCDIRTSGTHLICGGYNASGSAAYHDVTYTFYTGRWYHLVVTYNGNRLTYYLDGNILGSVATLARDSGTNPLYIGKRGTLAAPFNGTIDEVRIYNRSLSADEIWLHYQSEFSKYNSTQYRFYNNLTNLTDGQYTHYGWANDSAGNSNQTDLRYFNIDTINVTLNNPQNYTFTNQTLPVFNFTVRGGSTNYNCNLTINNSQYGSVTATDSIATTITANTSLVNGQSYLWFINCSSSGVWNVSQTRNITIDTTPPTINFTSPTILTNGTTNQSWLYVNTTVNDTNNMTAFIDFNRSLVGWWRFNNEAGENSTFFKDWSSYQNNGTCSGATCPTFNTSGKFGGAMTLNGINNRIDITNTTALPTGNISFGLWFNENPRGVSGGDVNGIVTTRTTGTNGIIMFTFDLSINITSCRVGNGTTDSAVSIGVIPFYTWHHVVCVFNGTNVVGYLDGVYTGTGVSITGNISHGGNISLGRYYSNQSSYFFNGSIDDVRIYNRALSPEEINASFNAGSYRLYRNFTNLTDGSYNYTAYVQDQAGNVNSTSNSNVTVLTTNCYCATIIGNYCYINENCSLYNTTLTSATTTLVINGAYSYLLYNSTLNFHGRALAIGSRMGLDIYSHANYIP